MTSHRVAGSTRPFWVLAVSFAFCGSAMAGALNGHPAAATSGSVTITDGPVTVDLDYAVFAPGTYPNAYPDKDTEYVYAYQAFVSASSPDLLFLSVGGNDNFPLSAADNPGNDPALGAGDVPVFQQINFVTKTFRNNWSPPVAAGGSSAVLLYTSPNSWELANAAVTTDGGNSANVIGQVPAPLPEPATAALLLGGVMVLARRVRRRRS